MTLPELTIPSTTVFPFLQARFFCNVYPLIPDLYSPQIFALISGTATAHPERRWRQGLGCCFSLAINLSPSLCWDPTELRQSEKYQQQKLKLLQQFCLSLPLFASLGVWSTKKQQDPTSQLHGEARIKRESGWQEPAEPAQCSYSKSIPCQLKTLPTWSSQTQAWVARSGGRKWTPVPLRVGDFSRYSFSPSPIPAKILYPK